ncbi:hypothetical protein GCM10009554_47130 [Kribbella koreensis]|uniref:Uncharacterized protein n=1 Tax=Kribbella koreensis TaxID=57909 RepID=A0ABN1QY65_9ACTN
MLDWHRQTQAQTASPGPVTPRAENVHFVAVPPMSARFTVQQAIFESCPRAVSESVTPNLSTSPSGTN